MSSAGSYGGGGSGMSGVLTITGDSGLTVTGNVTLTGLTSGSGIAFVGTSTTALQVQIDYLAMSDAASDGSAGFLGVLGSGTIIAPWGGISSGNMFIGPSAGNPATTGQQNIGIGQQAMTQIIDAANNIAIGFQAAQGCKSLTDNVAVGYQALSSNGGLGATGFGGNVSIGSNSLRNGTDMLLNIAIGDNAGVNYTTTESSNILIGNEGVVAESHTIRIGTDGSGAGQQDACYLAGVYGATGTTGTKIVTIDSDFRLAASSGTGGVTSITGNSGGAQTGSIILTGGTSGAVFTGSAGTITESFNFIEMPLTTAGPTAGYISMAGNPVFGLYGSVTNTFLGEFAGASITSGTKNTGIGQTALLQVAGGGLNTALGYGTLLSLIGGNNNTAIGQSSLANLASGSGNTGCGTNNLENLVSGSNNIALGANAGLNYTGAESANICIGNDGVLGESDAIHIGDTATQTTCFIAGIAGVTVANSAAVLINTTNGQLGTVPSSLRYKENVQDIQGDSKDIMKLRPVKFSYKRDANKETQYGLIAEEVQQTMPYLVVYNKDGQPETVKYHELPTLLLAEIQRLEARLKSLEEQFAARVR